MGDGSHFAIALILFWVAGVCFFVAFHPNGIQIDGRQAQNPTDVIRYLIGVIIRGSGQKGGGGKTGGAGETTST